MPKVTITEYCDFRTHEDYVWLPWKGDYIFAVSETHMPESFSEQNLMRGILAPIGTLGARACR